MVRDTVEGHEVCQSRDAKWLYLKDLYNHFRRPNFYDIGGTYTNDTPDFWLMYTTKQISNLFILHLFVINRQAGSFSISLSDTNEMTSDDRNNTLKLNSKCNIYKFENVPESNYNYVTTYSFSERDLEWMKDRSVLLGISFNTTPLKELQITMDSLKNLQDFGQLLRDPVGADFLFISADGAEFPVHKYLLAATSDVFKAMLKDDTKESINNSVKIDDISTEDLSNVIEFIYTGTIKDIENKNCFNLLMLGDRYDLKGLKELAQHSLAQLLNNDNALETLMVADMYNAPLLKTSAFKYIKSNIASLQSSIFHEISNIKLIQDLCIYLAL